jgi:hypothetical protein
METYEPDKIDVVAFRQAVRTENILAVVTVSSLDINGLPIVIQAFLATAGATAGFICSFLCVSFIITAGVSPSGN